MVNRLVVLLMSSHPTFAWDAMDHYYNSSTIIIITITHVPKVGLMLTRIGNQHGCQVELVLQDHVRYQLHHVHDHDHHVQSMIDASIQLSLYTFMRTKGRDWSMKQRACCHVSMVMVILMVSIQSHGNGISLCLPSFALKSTWENLEKNSTYEQQYDNGEYHWCMIRIWCINGELKLDGILKNMLHCDSHCEGFSLIGGKPTPYDGMTDDTPPEVYHHNHIINIIIIGCEIIMHITKTRFRSTNHSINGHMPSYQYHIIAILPSCAMTCRNVN